MTDLDRSILRRSVSASVAYPLLLLVIFLAGWHAASAYGLIPPYLVPSPSTVWSRGIETAGLLWGHSLVTSYEILIGFLLSVIGGVLLGAAIVSSRTLEQTLYPWLVVIQVIPKVAIGPLLVVWLGFGLGPKVLIAFLLGFFPILINTMLGLKSVPRDSIFLMQTMGASRLTVFRRLLLPHAMPSICGALKVAVTFATIGAIVGEFIGANIGLGYVLIAATGNLDTGLLFVALFWVTAVALLFYGAVAAIEKLLIPWHISVRAPTRRAASNRRALPGAVPYSERLAETCGRWLRRGLLLFEAQNACLFQNNMYAFFHLRIRQRGSGQLPQPDRPSGRRVRILAVGNVAHHRAVSGTQPSIHFCLCFNDSPNEEPRRYDRQTFSTACNLTRVLQRRMEMH